MCVHLVFFHNPFYFPQSTSRERAHLGGFPVSKRPPHSSPFGSSAALPVAEEFTLCAVAPRRAPALLESRARLHDACHVGHREPRVALLKLRVA